MLMKPNIFSCIDYNKIENYLFTAFVHFLTFCFNIDILINTFSALILVIVFFTFAACVFSFYLTSLLLHQIKLSKSHNFMTLSLPVHENIVTLLTCKLFVFFNIVCLSYKWLPTFAKNYF